MRSRGPRKCSAGNRFDAEMDVAISPPYFHTGIGNRGEHATTRSAPACRVSLVEKQGPPAVGILPVARAWIRPQSRPISRRRPQPIGLRSSASAMAFSTLSVTGDSICLQTHINMVDLPAEGRGGKGSNQALFSRTSRITAVSRVSPLSTEPAGISSATRPSGGRYCSTSTTAPSRSSMKAMTPLGRNIQHRARWFRSLRHRGQWF